MKVIIAGGREFNNYELLKKKLDAILKNHTDIEIVSGNARGADMLGEWYAKQNGYKVTQFIPDWGLGKSGGHVRNEKMAKYADACVVFWDGESRGTANMIENAKRYKLPLRIIRY